MQITKFGHSCVRIQHGDATVVIDPGGFSEAEALDGATAILITHEHFDHCDAAKVEASGARVWAVPGVANALRSEIAGIDERLTTVAPGDRFDVGVPVTAVGAEHAWMYDGFPIVDNSGYLLEVDGTTLFHPGDALTVPETEVDVLFVPVCAPWLKTAEALDYAREVKAPRNIGIHEAVYSEAGHDILRTHFTRFLGEDELEFELPLPGTDVELG